MVGESASPMVSGKGVHQPVKVSLLPLCEMRVTGNCAFVYATSYFLVCSVVILPVFIYAACKHTQLSCYVDAKEPV